MTQIPFPTFNWNSTNIIADANYFETQCTRFFKGPLKDEDDDSKLAYVLLWLNNREFESVYEDWTPPIKDENILKHFWKKFKEHFNRHMLHTVRQLQNETTNSFADRVKQHVSHFEYTTPEEAVITQLISGTTLTEAREQLLDTTETLTTSTVINKLRRQETIETAGQMRTPEAALNYTRETKNVSKYNDTDKWHTAELNTQPAQH